ncbi:prohibitin family protein [Sorangium sp. So ce1036]|uniref:prohibitin family protein n=1 Tax=Sorangium sp. So ce1036 TaxID=3133328 RepID=UPI003F0580B0
MSDEWSQVGDDGDEGGPAPRATWRSRAASALASMQFATYTTLIVTLLLIGFFWPRMFITIPAGHHGVMYRLFGGTVKDRVWKEGLNIVPPWDKLTIYETRLQERKISSSILSEEGVDLAVEVSVRFRPHLHMLGSLHQDIGPDYYERLIRPEVEAHVRHAFGSHAASDIYGSEPDIMQELVRPLSYLGRLNTDSGESRGYVDIEELKLINISLPDIVKAAIADRYRQEQLMMEYRYRLQREEHEAERKRTEAAGIRDYNLIASTISPDLLRWRSIEATLELARSQNAKVVVIGGGQGGLPFVMNLDGGAPPAPQDAASKKGNATDAAAPAANAAPYGPPAPPAAASP